MRGFIRTDLCKSEVPIRTAPKAFRAERFVFRRSCLSFFTSLFARSDRLEWPRSIVNPSDLSRFTMRQMEENYRRVNEEQLKRLSATITEPSVHANANCSEVLTISKYLCDNANDKESVDPKTN